MGFAALGAEELDNREVALRFLGQRHRIGLATFRCA
jgi:hypothetical protein